MGTAKAYEGHKDLYIGVGLRPKLFTFTACCALDVVPCLQSPSYFQHDFLIFSVYPPAVKGVGEYSREDLETGQLNGVDDGKNTTKLCVWFVPE